MKEAGDLLEFADKVQKSADSGGVVTRVPGNCLDALQTAVVHKIEEVAFAVSPAGAARAREQHASHSIVGRVFLSARPRNVLGWLLHSIYYMMFGMTVLFAGVLGHDIYVKASNREGGVIAIGVFVIFTVLLNILAAAADQPKSKTVAPPPPFPPAQSPAA